MARILVVEDRDVDRQYLATLLGYVGHTVVEASDGSEALDSAQQNRPDLIISDVLMPSIDGYEFVRQLREIPAVAQTPVIFYTASYHEREARTLARQCGVIDILMKPSEPQAILATIDAVLSRRSPAAALEPPDVEPFDREHARLVNATLLEKVSQLEAAEHRLAAVVGFCQHFAKERDPLTLLTELCTITREVTLAKHAVVALVNDEGSRVVRILTSGFYGQATSAMPSPSPLPGAMRALLVERKAVRSRGTDRRSEWLGFPPGPPDLFSYLAVPIASPARVYGWIGVRTKLGADEFTEGDEDVARILGVHAGIAYENARQVDDLNRHAAALRESDMRTQYALGAARMGVWELDLATDRLTWSNTMPEVFGVTPDQAPVTAAGFSSLIHPDDRQAVANSMARAAREGVDHAMEFRAIWPDGRTCWVLGQARVFRHPDGTPSRLLGVDMDISERKALETQLQQAQKLEAIGHLAGGIAHDFNNLLTAILGFSAMVIAGLADDDPKRADVLEIRKAGERAAGLTRQLLAFSRKQILRPRVLEVNDLVLGMENMLRRLLREHVNLVVSLQPHVGLINMDPTQLEQIVINLAVNAADAMPHGGKLTIETADVTLDEHYRQHHLPVIPGRYVMLAVSDTGVGMDEATSRRIFEPFFTTKEAGKGTGLGLSTVHGIVKQSGGDIWVYSAPGHGSTFKVYLPQAIASAPDEVKPAAAPDAILGGSETILLVEDDDAVRRLSRVALERSGYHVMEAEHPKAALRLVAEFGGRIDLLLSDVIMPESEGPPLYDRLVKIQPGVRVLYMSGYADDAVIRHGVLAEGTPFLQKPFTPLALTRTVREVLDAPPAGR